MNTPTGLNGSLRPQNPYNWKKGPMSENPIWRIMEWENGLFSYSSEDDLLLYL